VSVCPADALRHSRLGREDFKEVPIGQILSPGDFESFMATRRSVRVFKKEPLDRALAEDLISECRHSPTSTNTQNIRWLLLDDRPSIDRLARFSAGYYLTLARRIRNPLVRFGLYLTVGKRIVDSYALRLPGIEDHFRECLAGKDLVFFNAPVVAVASAPGLDHLALANINLAVGHLLLAAHARGIGTLFSGFSLTALRRDHSLWDELGIPRHHHVGAVLAMGHPAIEFKLSPPRQTPKIEWGTKS